MVKLLGTLLFACLTVPAQANTTLTLSGFSAEFASTAPPTVSVLADTGNYARLALPLLASLADVPGFNRYVDDLTELYLAPRPGYLIDGIVFSAKLNGWWQADAPPPGANNIVEPLAGNLARTTLGVMLYSEGRLRSATQAAFNLNGNQLIDLQLLNLHAAGPLALSLTTLLAIQDFDGGYEIDGEPYRLNAAASITLTAPVLTLYLSPLPVPEPPPWALLAAGLVLLRMRRPGAR